MVAGGETGQRLASLDGLRGAACILVLVAHGALPFALPYPQVLAIVGHMALVQFFVLSGFLISRPFWQGLLSEQRPLPSLRTFFRNRILRIWPLYFVVLGAAVVRFEAMGFAWHRVELLYNALFIQNFYWWYNTLVPVNWSIAMEEQFYVALPLLFLVLARCGLRMRWVVVGALLLGTLLVRFWAWHEVDAGGAYRNWLHANTFARFDQLMVGVLLAGAIQAGNARGLLQARGWLWAGYLLGGLSIGLFVQFKNGSNDLAPLWVEMVLPTLLALTGLLLLVAALQGGLLARLLGSRALAYCGRMSYSVYLWHTMVLWLASSQLGEGALGLAAYLVVSLAVGGASYHGIERVFLRFKRSQQPSFARPGN